LERFEVCCHQAEELEAVAYLAEELGWLCCYQKDQDVPSSSWMKTFDHELLKVCCLTNQDIGMSPVVHEEHHC